MACITHVVQIPGTTVSVDVWETETGWGYALYTSADERGKKMEGSRFLVKGDISTASANGADLTPEQIGKIAFILEEDHV